MMTAVSPHRTDQAGSPCALRALGQGFFITDRAVEGFDLGLEIEGFPDLLKRRMPISREEADGLFDVRPAILDKGCAGFPKLISVGVAHTAPFGSSLRLS